MNYIQITEKLQIERTSKQCAKQAKLQWDAVAKPLDGLGKLEDLFCRIAAIQQTADVQISKRGILAMCADNGIVEEGVTQSEQDITAIVAGEMAAGRSSVCRMAESCKADIFPIDMGIARDDLLPKNRCTDMKTLIGLNARKGVLSENNVNTTKGVLSENNVIAIKDALITGIIHRKIAHGTHNFLKQEAMSQSQMWQAIQTGADLVADCKEQGYTLLATGEMGIGNTTTSAAVAAALLGIGPEKITGRGAGLSDAGLMRKIEVIRKGLEKHELNSCNSGRDFAAKTLQCVGGFDIAGLVGVFVGGALYKVPIVIDGLISAVAALLAEKMFPGCVDYMLPSHMGQEPAMQSIMNNLGLNPIIYGNLALGEGTGAVLLFPLLDAAYALYQTGTGFEQMQIEQYERF